MKCQTADKLSQYVDHLLTEQEHGQIHTHLQSCDDCMRVVEAFMEEQRFLKETLQAPALPDDFATIVLDQLEPYNQKNVHQKRRPWKRIMLTAAGIVLALGLSSTLNPSFAQWIGGFFGTENADEGLKIAADAGLTEPVNLEVADNGITFKVEDSIVDSSRVALSFQVLNGNGKPQDTNLNLFHSSNNKITAIDQNGKILHSLGSGWWEGSDYGLVQLSLRHQETLEKVIIKFDLVELNGVKGNWKLEVPVDLTESKLLTTTIPLTDAKTSSHGVAINMKEFQFAPSSNEFLYETSFTEEEQERVKKDLQKLEEKIGKESAKSVVSSRKYGTAIEYHIENEDEKAIYHHNEGTVFPHGSGGVQSSSSEMEQLGQVAWNESFIPQKNDQKLTFVLDGVFKTVPSDFSIKIKPKELKQHPVSFEYEGNYMTIKKAKKENEFSYHKSLIPIEKETIFKIVMEGGKEPLSSMLGDWVLVDNKGKAYEDLGGSSILNEKDENGRYKTTIDLEFRDLDEIPEEFTLHLLSVTRYEKVKEKWMVPLYKSN